MKREKNRNFYKKQYRTRNFIDDRHDTYKAAEKHPEPTVCTQCSSHYKNGRWTWEPIPSDYHETVCPACLRISENYPAGIISLSGSFFSEHSREILNMVRNVGKSESSQHPLERIMTINRSDNDKTEIRTTGMHIANRIGNHLYDSYKGNIETSYEGKNLVRITWTR
jgi:hypothetical protein